MAVAKETALAGALGGMAQQDWDRLLGELLPSIHPVDQNATRIWFAFWPLKLDRLLRQAEDLDEVVRDRRLKGRFRLTEQLDSTVAHFHGRYLWEAVKRAVLEKAEKLDSADGFDLKKAVLETAAAAAKSAGVDPLLATGVTLAGFMAYRQLGHEAFRNAVAPASGRPVKAPSPEAVLAKRAKPTPAGWFSFLRAADRDYRITFDESRSDGLYTALHGQDLSMASANDKRDYSGADPRRLEGPVPFECRSGSCGFCWVGILGGAERLEAISEYEVRRLRYFGYVSHDAPAETHPPIRLACQAQCLGNVTIVVPPWNGVLRGRT